MAKKGKINNHEEDRLLLVDLVLRGIGVPHNTYINRRDTKTTLVSNALRFFKPDIFFRGYDKKIETMPKEERQVCEELGIEIRYAKNRIGERHSSVVFK
jgi:hypothetical protein